MGAAVAKAVNQKVVEIARLFSMPGDDEPLDFRCECGCGGCVSLTLALYEAEGGAWVPGHEPGFHPEAVPDPAPL